MHTSTPLTCTPTHIAANCPLVWFCLFCHMTVSFPRQWTFYEYKLLRIPSPFDSNQYKRNALTLTPQMSFWSHHEIMFALGYTTTKKVLFHFHLCLFWSLFSCFCPSDILLAFCLSSLFFRTTLPINTVMSEWVSVHMLRILASVIAQIIAQCTYERPLFKCQFRGRGTVTVLCQIMGLTHHLTVSFHFARDEYEDGFGPGVFVWQRCPSRTDLFTNQLNRSSDWLNTWRSCHQCQRLKRWMNTHSQCIQLKFCTGT